MSDHLQIILEETGQFGPFQWRLSAITSFLIFMTSFRIYEYMFTTARIPTRCIIKECENPNTTQFTPPWLSHAVPFIDGNFDNCHRYARAADANITASTDDSCPTELFDTNTTVACEIYLYENHDTVSYDFGLACDEWHRSLIGSVRMGGMVLGMPLVGFVADRWGRRPTIIVNEFLAACLGVLRSQSTSYGGYVALVLIEALICGSQFNCVYVLVTETMGVRYRGAAGAMIKSLFSLGSILLTLLAWLVPNWRTLILVLYAPQLLICCYFWIVPESIRWNMTKGNYAAAEATLKKVARMNGKKLSEESLRELREAAEKEKQQLVEKEKKPWLMVQVFRSKPILLRCVVLSVLWMTLMVVYYGLSINATNIFGNKYLNFVLVFTAEMHGALLAVVLMNRAGRRNVLAVAFLVCAAGQITYIFVPKGMVVVSLIVYMIGNMCVGLVMATQYAFTMELYPTEYRQNLLNISAMFGKLGAVAAPLTPVLAIYWAPLPFVLFASLALTSGLLVLVLPETRGTVLPDTMQQATRLTSTSPQGTEDLGLLASRSRTQ